ncbi:hypothetical protein OAU13_01190 [bacterium]|nr:hypothetical protein [bacterium]
MYRNYIKYCTPLVALLASSVIAQTNDVVDSPGMKELMVLTVQGKFRMREASATPWEQKNIIVTSAHINAEIVNELCTNKEKDVKFISEQGIDNASWRNPIPDEKVTYVGRIEVLSEDKSFDMVMVTKSEGKVIENIPLGFNGKVTNDFWIGQGFTVKGMSGGPVIAASDKKVVGIIVGSISKSAKRFDTYRKKYGEDLTVVVPYNVVDVVWRSCK